MKHATKATVKRLEAIVKAADADPKNYYNDREMAAYRLLQWIKAAEESNRQEAEMRAYDPEGYADWRCGLMDNPYSIYYSMDGLTIKGRFGADEYWLTGLSITCPELVHYINCNDINCATISDVNKLAKAVTT